MEEIPNKGGICWASWWTSTSSRRRARTTVEIVVEPYPYPVSYKGEYHYRSGSTKQELKGAALDRFLLGKQGQHWDGVPVPGFGSKDLSRSSGPLPQLAERSGRAGDELLRKPMPL